MTEDKLNDLPTHKNLKIIPKWALKSRREHFDR